MARCGLWGDFLHGHHSLESQVVQRAVEKLLLGVAGPGRCTVVGSIAELQVERGDAGHVELVLEHAHTRSSVQQRQLRSARLGANHTRPRAWLRVEEVRKTCRDFISCGGKRGGGRQRQAQQEKRAREREKKKKGKRRIDGRRVAGPTAAAGQKKCALKTHSRTTHARTRTHERKHNVHAPCMRKSRQAAIATNLSGGHGGVALLRCSPTSRPRQTASACGAAVRVARGERVAAASVFDRKSGAWKVTRPVTCRSLAASFRAARTTNRRIPTEPSYFFPAFLRRRPALALALARARRSAGACVRALLCRLRGNHHKHQHQRRRRHDDEVAHPASNCITLGRVQPPLRSATLRLSVLPHHRSLTTATPPNQSKLPRKSYVGGGGPSVRSFVRRRSFGCSVVRSFVRDGTAREATQPQSNKAH